MRRLFWVVIALSLIFTTQVEAKQNQDYLFLITITKEDGTQKFILADHYALSGVLSASSVAVGHVMGLDNQGGVCTNNMYIVVRGGLLLEKGQQVLPDFGESFYNIGMKDALTIVIQGYGPGGEKKNRTYSVKIHECPFPLITYSKIPPSFD